MIIINTLQKIVQKLNDIRVYVTISCVIISLTTTSLAIDYLAIFGVLTLGILHGANDLSLLTKHTFYAHTVTAFFGLHRYGFTI
jgi:hypothetical protein